MTDLRSFVEQVRSKRARDIVEVTRRVSPRFETAAIVAKLEEQRRSPLLLFRDVEGSDLPLVTNVCGSMGRIAMAMGCALKEVGARYAQAEADAVAPTVVEAGAVHEHVHRGDAADLSMLPSMRYHEGDADRPWISAGIVVARDPDSGVNNLSYHRMMVLGPRRLSIYVDRGRHLESIRAGWDARGEPMPVAVILGVHPAFSLGALYAGAASVDELSIVGGLLGEPLPVVHTVSGGALPVPAGAEIVIEGHVPAGVTVEEGPFGEFTGYGTGTTRSPVIEVDAITHRDAPMFQDIVSGRMEHLLMSMPSLEHRTWRDAKKAGVEVTAVGLPAAMTSVIAIRKTDDDQPRRLIETLLEGDVYAKQVIVVDEGVDVGDMRAVVAAMALSTQADRDVFVLADRQGTPLDPSCPGEDGRVAKLGIDATKRLSSSRAVTPNRIPAEVYDAVDVAEVLGRRRSAKPDGSPA